MVRGIERFREYFRDYSGQYVIIGGTACDVILGREGADFRATKDLDVVLVMEALNEAFVEQFLSFVEAAGYKHINKGTGKEQFYRFQCPEDVAFPFMVELFCRRPEYLRSVETRFAPIHVSDEVISLSAILLEDDYYELLRRGAVEVDGISVLDMEYLIVFKIKAWLDLSERKRNGENIDSKNIKKHKNDVMRLAAYLSPDAELKIYGSVLADAEEFMRQAVADPIDVMALGIKEVSYSDIMDRLRGCYDIWERGKEPLKNNF